MSQFAFLERESPIVFDAAKTHSLILGPPLWVRC